MLPDPQFLLELIRAEMPYGKYKGTKIHLIPEHYLVWMKREGFPKGKLGAQLETMYEIRLNGLYDLIIELKKQNPT